MFNFVAEYAYLSELSDNKDVVNIDNHIIELWMQPCNYY